MNIHPVEMVYTVRRIPLSSMGGNITPNAITQPPRPIPSTHPIRTTTMTQQKRKHSFLEASLNVLIGFAISTLANAAILPHYGLPFRWSSMWEIGLWFTLISIIRSYYVRRLFVRLHNAGILK